MAVFFLLLFVFLKQFYIFTSGSIGVGDMCLLISSLCLARKRVKEGKTMLPEKKDWLIWMFIGITVLINGIYSLMYGNVEFLKFSLFWIFNGIFVWTIRYLAEIDPLLMKHSAIVMKISIVTQLLLWLSGEGRLFVEYNGTRYMGSFNDPNQMAFFVFCMMLLLYLYSSRYRDFTYGLFYGIGVWLIIQTKSTGILLGVIILTLGIGILECKRLYDSKKVTKAIWIVGGILIMIMGIGLFLYLWPEPGFQVQPGHFTMTDRIKEKIQIISSGGLQELLINRGSDKVILYPQYFLYGAGEGGLWRFTKTDVVTEIHNCLLSILFCYGFAPAVIMARWIWNQMKNAEPYILVAVAALLVESCFLVNYRQPFFWWILLSGDLYNSSSGE